MTKKHQLTPKWVLRNFPDSIHSDGNGIGTIYTSGIEVSIWIERSLELLRIPFDVNVVLKKDDEILFRFEFVIDDFQIVYPTLYKKFKKMEDAMELHSNV